MKASVITAMSIINGLFLYDTDQEWFIIGLVVLILVNIYMLSYLLKNIF